MKIGDVYEDGSALVIHLGHPTGEEEETLRVTKDANIRVYNTDNIRWFNTIKHKKEYPLNINIFELLDEAYTEHARKWR